MKIVKWVLLAALAALPAAPQEKKEEAQKPRQETVKRVIPVKYANVRSLANTFAIFNCGITGATDLNVLVVSCPPDVVTLIEDAVKRLDVPPPAAKNVELTAYFLTGGESGMEQGDPLPPELEPVVKQMRSVLAYRTFRLLDVLVLRTRAGEPGSVGGVNSSGVSEFKVKSASPAADGGPIRIDGLAAAIQMHSKQLASISAGVDIREGQKVVVGKSTMAGPGPGRALILVLSAKVL